MKTRFILAAAVAAASVSAPAMAQDKAPAPKKVSEAQAKAAVRAFQLLGGALQSEQVPQQLKDALFGCLYGNSLKTISEGMTAELQKRGIDGSDDTQALMAVAAACGIRAVPNPAPAE